MAKVLSAHIRRIAKAQERSLELRKAFFPNVSEKDLWTRKKHHGYTTIPRTMPQVMNIIDELSKNTPASRVYLPLWMRNFDQSLLIIDNPKILAYESGFSGERAVSTWKHRMRILQDLGFVLATEGSSGPFHYVLLLNPHTVAWRLKDRIREVTFRQLIERASEIGAKDMVKPPVGRKVETVRHESELKVAV